MDAMQAATQRNYKGFRATGATMYRLAQLEPTFMGAVRTDSDGFLS